MQIFIAFDTISRFLSVQGKRAKFWCKHRPPSSKYKISCFEIFWSDGLSSADVIRLQYWRLHRLHIRKTTSPAMFYVWIISNRTTTCSAASHCLRPLPSCEHAALFLHNGKNITDDLPFMFSIGYFCILNRRHTHFIYCLDRIWCYEVSTMSTSSHFIVHNRI